jgi:ATP-dependent Lon protease
VPTNERLLPLFPLGVVLFPDSSLPLHIFEERYKILIRLAVEQGTEFGINLVENGVMARIGCTARVRDVLRRYDDGRMDIVVEGKRRYELVEFHDDRAPYFVGSVVYADPRPGCDPTILAETLALYNKMMGVIYRDGAFQIGVDSGEGALSFRMAQKAGLDLADRQRLLEEDSEDIRLQWLLGWFRSVIPKLENAAVTERIVRNDGYL